MTIIKTVCMYCGKDCGDKDGNGVEGISHGICPECESLGDNEQGDDARMALYKARMPQSFSEFIKK